MSIVVTGWLSSIPYVFAIAGMLAASYFSDKTLNRKAFVWPLLLIGAIAFYGSYLVGRIRFLVIICFTDNRRCGDVFTLWAFLCHHP